jgi:ubiquinone/menaquinone biosynthesis C-methylase UbiE
MFRPKDRQKCLALFQKHYASRKFYDAVFRDTIKHYLKPGRRVLDAGCGTYMKLCKELSGTAEVVGIDLEPTLDTRNETRPFGVRGDLNQLPFPSQYFDMVISRSVIEHLEDPLRVFQEFARVLRPNGKVVIITPNKYDYVSLIASVTPYSFHRALVSRIFQVPADDVFPTLYRANTRTSLGKTLQSAGFEQVRIEMVNHYPAYLMFSPVLFRIGMLYERLTSLRMFQSLRGSILCVMQKRESSSAVRSRTSTPAQQRQPATSEVS